MSAETKKAVEEAGKYLKRADEYMSEAGKQAQKSGDKQLVEKVTKIKKETRETHEGITKRLKEG